MQKSDNQKVKMVYYGIIFHKNIFPAKKIFYVFNGEKLFMTMQKSDLKVGVLYVST